MFNPLGTVTGKITGKIPMLLGMSFPLAPTTIRFPLPLSARATPIKSIAARPKISSPTLNHGDPVGEFVLPGPILVVCFSPSSFLLSTSVVLAEVGAGAAKSVAFSASLSPRRRFEPLFMVLPNTKTRTRLETAITAEITMHRLRERRLIWYWERSSFHSLEEDSGMTGAGPKSNSSSVGTGGVPESTSFSSATGVVSIMFNIV
mmetsp:Transcript_21550/g.43212  ORF Transcript_21550/g.43212 Transcript_21550/m.43212 type:complete len:204 (+) Transcript_21550:380-991(+)